MKIKDNFLKQEDFDEIEKLIMKPSNHTPPTPQFQWFFVDKIDYKEETVDKFQFVHVFYDDHNTASPHIEKIIPILELIQPLAIYRIKANLLTKTSKIIENEFHTDFTMSEEKMKLWTTSIFYINTNNGYTKFEDGTKVESVANRMVTFPANLKHTGTSCTDETTRVVINFNYFEKTL